MRQAGETALYVVTFIHPTRKLLANVAASAESMLALAHILEDGKVPFKVCCNGGSLNYGDLGLGHFAYWLDKDSPWVDGRNAQP